MRRRNRLLLIVCLMPVAVIGFVLWTSRGGTKPALSATFVGYTNRLTITTGSSNLSNVLIGLVRASNSGPTTLQCLSSSTYFRPRDSGIPITIYETQLLKPGESMTAEAYLPTKFDSWEIRLPFCRYAYWDRIKSSVGKLGSVTLERWVARVAPYQEISFITLGPITNQPPTGNPLNR